MEVAKRRMEKDFEEGYWCMRTRLGDLYHRAWRYIPDVCKQLDGVDLQRVEIVPSTGSTYVFAPYAPETCDALTRTWEALRNVWNSPKRSNSFVHGLLAAIVQYTVEHANNKASYSENNMGTQVTYTNIALVMTAHGTRWAQFDPVFFVVKKGDVIVVEKDDNFDIATVEEVRHCEALNNQAVWTIAARLDLEQLAVRKEQAARREQARNILREAAKRNSEMDLYEQVKAKLTAEEDALVKEALGYGTKTEAGAG